VAELGKNVTAEEINSEMKKAAEGQLKGILEYCQDPVVSSDIVGNTSSSVFDALSTKVMDNNFIKVVSWYDNEWGSSNRTVDIAKRMASL